jgi:hypothetical protein
MRSRDSVISLPVVSGRERFELCSGKASERTCFTRGSLVRRRNRFTSSPDSIPRSVSTTQQTRAAGGSSPRMSAKTACFLRNERTILGTTVMSPVPANCRASRTSPFACARTCSACASIRFHVRKGNSGFSALRSVYRAFAARSSSCSRHQPSTVSSYRHRKPASRASARSMNPAISVSEKASSCRQAASSMGTITSKSSPTQIGAKRCRSTNTMPG